MLASSDFCAALKLNYEIITLRDVWISVNVNLYWVLLWKFDLQSYIWRARQVFIVYLRNLLIRLQILLSFLDLALDNPNVSLFITVQTIRIFVHSYLRSHYDLTKAGHLKSHSYTKNSSNSCGQRAVSE